MNPAAWVGLGFVASSGNVNLQQIKDLGCIRVVAPQIAWAAGSPHALDDENLIRGCWRIGLDAAGWGWCQGDDVVGEARYHVERCRQLGLRKFIANMEEPYDAHGDQSSPKFDMCDKYLGVFRSLAPEAEIEIAVTTTPRWASDHGALREAGAVHMPQCFSGEVTSGDATIPAAVKFSQDWGWTTDRIRPLVQTYTTGGVYPDPNVYNTDAFTWGVGVVPYILEQADMNGLKIMESAILREPAASPIPIPPPNGGDGKPDNGGGSVPPDLPFCRALYPPDAVTKGKTPSKDGPDVVAVKRAISRMGLWPWQKFDSNYSNAFSHGKSSGKESDSGVQGFQIKYVAAQPTGWYGKTTHETLVKSKIPAGKPNAGQWAFDQTAVNLYKQAKP
jgi:hypothetical protein